MIQVHRSIWISQNKHIYRNFYITENHVYGFLYKKRRPTPKNWSSKKSQRQRNHFIQKTSWPIHNNLYIDKINTKKITISIFPNKQKHTYTSRSSRASRRQRPSLRQMFSSFVNSFSSALPRRGARKPLPEEAGVLQRRPWDPSARLGVGGGLKARWAFSFGAFVTAELCSGRLSDAALNELNERTAPIAVCMYTYGSSVFILHCVYVFY